MASSRYKYLELVSWTLIVTVLKHIWLNAEFWSYTWISSFPSILSIFRCVPRPPLQSSRLVVVFRYFLSNASKINLKIFWDFGTRVAKESTDHWYLAASATCTSSCKDLLRVYEWPRTNSVAFLRCLCTGPGAMSTVVGANNEYGEVLVTWDVQVFAFTGVRHVIMDDVTVTRLIRRQIVRRSCKCCIVKKPFSVCCRNSSSRDWCR